MFLPVPLTLTLQIVSLRLAIEEGTRVSKRTLAGGFGTMRAMRGN